MIGQPENNDLIGQCSMPELADALRAIAPDLLRRWEMLVGEMLPAADELTLAQVRDHIPQTLMRFADALASASPGASTALGGLGSKHAAARFHEGFKIEEVVMEYRLLRRILLDELEAFIQRRLSPRETAVLHDGIDAVLEEAVSAFASWQSREISSAAESESRFLNYVSHDLRNQLNQVSIIIDVLAQKMDGIAHVAEEIARAKRVQRSIIETIDGMERLLQFIRLHKQAIAIRPAQVDLRDVAASVCAEFESDAREKGIELQLIFPSDALVESDRSMLLLILQNLIGNAVKYSEYGIIRVAAAREQKFTAGALNRSEQKPRDKEQAQTAWTIAVADEGPGIAPELRETIFGEFVRGETHQQPGAGLGLAIAWQAARLIGGKLEVESAVNVGTTFRLTLPD